MIVPEPVLRGGVCLTAHPDGCAARVVRDVSRAKADPTRSGPSSVLVVGSSSGLGLAARIYATFGVGAATVGVHLDRAGTERRTGTAGWYNTAAVRAELARVGRWGRDVCGDAFSDEVKQRVVDVLRDGPGQVDLVVHSLAAPRRLDPVTGETHRAVIAAVGEPYTDLTFDVTGETVRTTTLPAATPDQVAQTVSVMGGADWARWIDALDGAGVLAPDARTVAFTYVGPEFLERSYRAGTLGVAKGDLEDTAAALHRRLAARGGAAYAVAASALITPASAVIPVQSLYTVLLSRVLAERGALRDPLDHARELFALLADNPVTTDDRGRVRLDAAELDREVQAEVRARWARASTATVAGLGAAEYRAELLTAHGFGLPGVDYDRPVDPRRDLAEPAMAVGSSTSTSTLEG